MTVTTTPNLIPSEGAEEHVARMKKQKIGDTKGIHPKVLAAQKAGARITRIANKRSKS